MKKVWIVQGELGQENSTEVFQWNYKPVSFKIVADNPENVIADGSRFIDNFDWIGLEFVEAPMDQQMRHAWNQPELF